MGWRNPAFIKMKEGLTTARVLGYPDPSKSYILENEASTVGMGTVLSQIQDKERGITYYS